MQKLLISAILSLALTVPAFCQSKPSPAPTPASNGVWTLVKHVRFPIVSDSPVGTYPTMQICEHEAYIYGIDHPQWWTDYTCELRAAKKLGGHFHHHHRWHHHRR